MARSRKSIRRPTPSPEPIHRLTRSPQQIVAAHRGKPVEPVPLDDPLRKSLGEVRAIVEQHSLNDQVEIYAQAISQLSPGGQGLLYGALGRIPGGSFQVVSEFVAFAGGEMHKAKTKLGRQNKKDLDGLQEVARLKRAGCTVAQMMSLLGLSHEGVRQRVRKVIALGWVEPGTPGRPQRERP